MALGAWQRRSARRIPTPLRAKLRIGVMGVSFKGRGLELAKGFAALPGVEVAYICDVDERNVGKGVDAVAKKQEKSPTGVGDFRRDPG